MKKAFIGIDPGSKGFITIIADDTEYFYSMPTHKVETGKLTAKGKSVMKSVYYEDGLKDLIFEIHTKFKGYKLYAAIEDVHGREGWSATNTFNFGYITGQQRLLLIMIGAEVIVVRPQKWQSVMYKNIDRILIPSSTGKTMVNDTKAMSEKVAKMLAPHVIFSKQGVFKKDGTTHKADDNKTDSYLICRYLTSQH